MKRVKRTCTLCTGGWNTCGHCGGTGTERQIVSIFPDIRERDINCMVCHGQRKTMCTFCHGRGYTEEYDFSDTDLRITRSIQHFPTHRNDPIRPIIDPGIARPVQHFPIPRIDPIPPISSPVHPIDPTFRKVWSDVDSQGRTDRSEDSGIITLLFIAVLIIVLTSLAEQWLIVP